MTEDDPISAEQVVLREGKEIALPAHLLTPSERPLAWDLDEFGAPRWIVSQPLATLAPWATIVPAPRMHLESWEQPSLAEIRGRGPAQMPSVHVGLAMKLAGVTGEERPGRGNPGLRRSQRELVRWCAWMRDVREAEPSVIRPFIAGARGDDRSARRRVLRYISVGRSLLHDEGVIPWMLWPRGELPQLWWKEMRFLEALTAWYSLYVSRNRPVLERLLDARRSAVLYARALKARQREIEAETARRPLLSVLRHRATS